MVLVMVVVLFVLTEIPFLLMLTSSQKPTAELLFAETAADLNLTFTRDMTD